MKRVQIPVFLLFFLFILLLFLGRIDSDGDFFQHVNIGRFVVHERRLPYLDDLTFTANGKPYLGYSWGTGVVFFLLYSKIGPLGVNLFIAFMAVLTFLLCFILLRLYKVSFQVTILTLGLIAPIISTRWPSRPEIVTYPFLIGLLLIHQLKKKDLKFLFLWPLIIFIWAIFYTNSVLVGLAVLLVFGLPYIYQKQRNKRELFYYSLSIVLSLFTSLLSGYGFKALFFILMIPRMTHFHGDWAGIFEPLLHSPLNYNHLLSYQYNIILYILYVSFFVVVIYLSLNRILNFIIFFIFSLGVFLPVVASRILPVSIFLALPLLAILFDHLKGARKKIITALCVCLIGLFSIPTLLFDPPSVGEDKQFFSPAVVAFIKDNDLSGNAFNSQRIGSFLSYNFYPQIKVFSDTRDDLFVGLGVLEEMEALLYHNLNITFLLNRYQINTVIADISESSAYQSLFYSPQWKIVFIDDLYVIAIRKEIADIKKIKTYDFIDPYNSNGIKTGGDATKALEEYREIYTRNPSSFNNTFRLALSLISNNQTEEAEQLLTQIKTGGAPNSSLFSIDKDTLLTEIYLDKKNCLMAKKSLERLSKTIKHKLILLPTKQLPSQVNKYFSYYYLICEYNPKLAEKYLKDFVNQAEINDQIKVEGVSRFKLLQSEISAAGAIH